MEGGGGVTAFIMPTVVKSKPGESKSQLIQRFKKTVLQAQIIDIAKEKQAYIKPSEKRKIKKNEQRRLRKRRKRLRAQR